MVAVVEEVDKKFEQMIPAMIEIVNEEHVRLARAQAIREKKVITTERSLGTLMGVELMLVMKIDGTKEPEISKGRIVWPDDIH